MSCQQQHRHTRLPPPPGWWPRHRPGQSRQRTAILRVWRAREPSPHQSEKLPGHGGTGALSYGAEPRNFTPLRASSTPFCDETPSERLGAPSSTRPRGSRHVSAVSAWWSSVWGGGRNCSRAGCMRADPLAHPSPVCQGVEDRGLDPATRPATNTIRCRWPRRPSKDGASMGPDMGKEVAGVGGGMGWTLTERRRRELACRRGRRGQVRGEGGRTCLLSPGHVSDHGGVSQPLLEVEGEEH